MSFVEPQARILGRPAITKNPYQGRWRLWYSLIADELIKDPTIKAPDIATKLNRSRSTIEYIMNTDLFRDYLSQRRTAFTKAHDQALRDKLVGLATKAVDNVADQLEKKKDQVPIKVAAEIAMGALEKLGYGVEATQPAVVVNNNTDARSVTVTPAALPELEAARQALRAAEAARRPSSLTSLPASEPVGAVIDASGVVSELMEGIQGASND